MVDFTFTKPNSSKVVVGNKSITTGKMGKMEFNMSVTEFDNCFDLWEKGTLIQNAFPMLNADEREFIMTGMTPDDWSNEVPHYKWPDGSTVHVSDYCEEEDKWRGDDYDLIEDCYQS